MTTCDFNTNGFPDGAGIQKILQKIVGGENQSSINKESNMTKIALPLADEKLSMHFGHCQSFALVEVDLADRKILGKKILEAPEHQPGLLPRWLHEKGANIIIAGGMGFRAQQLFAENDIKVVIGASVDTPEEIVNAFLNQTLQTGENVCDH